MTAHIFFGFTGELAKKYGLEAAVVHQWILSRQFSLDVTIDVLVGNISFLNKKELEKCLDKLKKQSILVEYNGVYKILVSDKDVKEVKKKKKEEKVEDTIDEQVQYTRIAPDGRRVVITSTRGKLINDLINAFEAINPGFVDFYRQPHQRKALDRLVDRFAIDKIFTLLHAVPFTNQMKYAPIITTPLEFERLAPKLLAFIAKEQAHLKSNNIDITI